MLTVCAAWFYRAGNGKSERLSNKVFDTFEISEGSLQNPAQQGAIWTKETQSESIAYDTNRDKPKSSVGSDQHHSQDVDDVHNRPQTSRTKIFATVILARAKISPRKVHVKAVEVVS